ncbi:MAG: nitroreductase family protein [Chloroflexi bacterium]|nr:MAG: nitroreductase family protein [Chloroflexota bacterium]
MPQLHLSPEKLLTTTRSVRKRLDFSRPVELEVIRECLELAVQAPTGANSQGWHFLVVTDQEQRKALGAIYRKGYMYYRQKTASAHPLYEGRTLPPEHAATLKQVRNSSEYLADHMHEAPVLLVPCIWGRAQDESTAEQAGVWGSILPAVWSFMLAARLHGLGTAWTSVHLYYEQEAAQVLGIPYEQVMQAALIPVAYTLGTDFKPAPRIPLESVLHWDRW